MAATEKFKQDVLLKEEAFLRQVKAKLTDQLNRLKVEEVALLKMSSSEGGTTEGQTRSNAFPRNQRYLQETHAIQGADGFDAEGSLNKIPLQGLHSSQRQQVLNDYEDEELDEEQQQYSYQQCLNVIMSNSEFQDNEHLDNEVSRSIAQSILHKEIVEFEDKADEE